MIPIVTIATVRRALAAPLPGPAAQLRMAAQPRSQVAEYGPRPAPRPGAVLLLLYPCEGGLCLPLTLRNAHLAHHGGQISLPGGGVEPGDPSWWHAALREAHEECGIDPAAVAYLGALTPLYVTASNYEVHPFVGLAPARPHFYAQAAEVAEIITLSLDDLLDPAHKGEREGLWDGRQRRVPYYCADGSAGAGHGEAVVWGATAMILSELEVALAAARS